MWTIRAVCLLACCALDGAAYASMQARAPVEDPSALIALESARNSLLTGEIHWSVRAYVDQSHWKRRWNYTSRFAGDDYVLEDRGDDDGVLLRNEGEPAPVIGRSPVRWLLHEGKQWELRDGNDRPRVNLTPVDVYNARCFGMVTDVPQGFNVHQALWGSGAKREYQTRARPGGLVEVVALSSNGLWRVEYILDPARDCNPIEVTVTNGGQLVGRSRVTLRKFGDVWFPEKVDIFRGDHKDGREPAYEIRVTKASFNQKEHPLSFAPADIGVETGMTCDVFASNEALLRGEKARMMWDGGKLAPSKEVLARISSGELRYGPTVTESMALGDALGIGPEDVLAGWRSYTKRFIARYELEESQEQRAMAILNDCVEQGTAHARRTLADFQRTRRLAAETADDGSLSSDARQQRLNELARTMEDLQRPLWEIFHLQLRPRLSRLPTRAQMKAAAEREAKENIRTTTRPGVAADKPP